MGQNINEGRKGGGGEFSCGENEDSDRFECETLARGGLKKSFFTS